jgi:hypothetical protein
MIYKVFYTNLFIRKRFDGLSIGPFVFIRPECRNDKGLLAHELVHVEQFYRYWGLNGLLYFFSKKWRLRFELEAYKKQVDVNHTTYFSRVWMARSFARILVDKYGFDEDIHTLELMLLGRG